jgi:hypothetical protein
MEMHVPGKQQQILEPRRALLKTPNSFHEKAGRSQDGFGVSLCGS